MRKPYPELKDLLGQTLARVENQDNQELLFVAADGHSYALRHHQSCCEDVYIESIVGNLADLVGEPLLLAEESTGETPSGYKFEYEPESYTWTFYKFATRKGYVDIRWLGTSNGYYSECVSFEWAYE